MRRFFQKNWLLTILAVVVSLGVLIGFGWLIRNAVRAYLADPLMGVVWVGRLLYSSIPQEVVWGAFLVIAYLIAFTSLQRRPQWQRPGEKQKARAMEQRVSILARWYLNRNRRYYRHRLQNALTDILVDILAQKQHSSSQDVKIAIRNGRIDLPPDILKYAQDGLSPWPPTPIRRRGILEFFFRKSDEDQAHIQKMEEVMVFLEQQLEGTHDR
jgi:hypothetical protein